MTSTSDEESRKVEARNDFIGEVVNGHSNGGKKHYRTIAIAALGISILLAGVLGVDRLSQTAERSHRNADIVDAIQEERARAVRMNCEGQNARNRETVRRVRERFRSLSPTERREGREGRDYTIALVNALAPVRNCDRVVRRTVVEGNP
jgi:hypothetical protein